MRFLLCSIFMILGLMSCTSSDHDIGSSHQNGNQTSNQLDPQLDVTSKEYVRTDSAAAQTLYVPVYSHIYQHNQQKTFNLTATLSFRNIDLNRSVTLTKVLYYDSAGNLVKNYLDEAETLKPLASTSFVVEEDDLRGGVGANFIVAWESDNPISPPVVEAVMISTSQQQGISFVSKARILSQKINS